MNRSYIFGTPRGHDIYESDDNFKKYSQSFYVSSRKGSWLIVDRVPDGQSINSIYSYLKYGLVESQGRPNSYFGMSLVVEGGYISDFKKIYDEFERLFDKLVEKGMFRKTGNGSLQYTVSKFKEIDDVSSWLEANISNILSATAGSIVNFDSSFTFEKIGLIDTINVEETAEAIIKRFKQYSIIALSPQFGGGTEEETGDGGGTIVLDYFSLEEYYHSLNESVVQLAVNKTPSAKVQLEAYLRKIYDVIREIVTYVKSAELSNDEMQKFTTLREKYRTLANTIDALIQNPQPPQPPQPPERKRCPICRRELPISFFEKGRSECIACHQRLILRRILSISVPVILAAIISIIFVLKEPKKDGQTLPLKPTDTVEVKTPVPPADGSNIKVDMDMDADVVDASAFNGCLSQGDIKYAYREIKDKQNGSAYKAKLKEGASQHLCKIIKESDKASITERIKTDFNTNEEAYKFLGFQKDKWTNDGKTYHNIKNKLASLTEMTTSEKNQYKKDIKDLPQGLKDDLQEKIDNKGTKSATGNPKSAQTTPPKNTKCAKIRHYKSDGTTLIGGEVSIDVSNSATYEYSGEKGEFFEIESDERITTPRKQECNHDIHRPNDKNKTLRIKIQNFNKSDTYKCGNATIKIVGKGASER